MEANLSVFLRDNTHNDATWRLLLKADQFSISYSRTPIHIAIPYSEPEIFDLGATRPSITISGVIDTIGGDTSNTTSNFWGMASETIVGPNGSGGTNSKVYYIPYKNYLEEKLVTLTTDTSKDLQIEVGNALYAKALSSSNLSTGGGIYSVGVQQFQFALAPGMEDRYQFSIQFVAKFRTGSTYRAAATTDKIAFP
mgnify:FL=1